MMILLNDHAFWMYFAVMFVSLVGVYVYGYWWWKIKKASSIYISIVFLLFGLAVINGILIYGRYYSLQNNFAFILSWWWPLRKWATLIPLSYIVGRQVYRVFFLRYVVERERFHSDPNLSHIVNNMTTATIGMYRKMEKSIEPQDVIIDINNIICRLKQDRTEIINIFKLNKENSNKKL